MDHLSITEQFIDLRSISDNVDDYLSRELFQDSFGVDSDYTMNDVLRECYVIVLQELRDLGIQFTMEIDDLLEDWYIAKHIYFIRQITDAYTLTKLCKEGDIKNKLETLLQAPEESEDIFSSLIGYLSEKYPDKLEYQYVNDFSSNIVSTERFCQHIRAIIDALAAQDAVPMPDITLAKSYIEKITGLRKFASTATYKIIEQLHLSTQIDKIKIKKLLDEYDMDKLSPDRIRLYSIIDNEAASDLYPQLGTFKETMMQLHHERAHHHLEHWIKYPNPHPTVENLILLVAHCYEPGATAASFWEEIDDMINKGTAIFNPEDVTFILAAANCVFARSQDMTIFHIGEES